MLRICSCYSLTFMVILVIYNFQYCLKTGQTGGRYLPDFGGTGCYKTRQSGCHWIVCNILQGSVGIESRCQLPFQIEYALSGTGAVNSGFLHVSRSRKLWQTSRFPVNGNQRLVVRVKQTVIVARRPSGTLATMIPIRKMAASSQL